MRIIAKPRSRHSWLRQVVDATESLAYFDIRRLLIPVLFNAAGRERPRAAANGVSLRAGLELVGLEFSDRLHSAGADAFNRARLVGVAAEWTASRIDRKS